MFHGKARAIIPHEKSWDGRSAGLRRSVCARVVQYHAGSETGAPAKLDARPLAFAGKFPGIAQKVIDGNAQQVFVSTGAKIRRDDKFHDALGVGLLELLSNMGG